ncbi:hypothetical protein GCM10010306_062030 [Streptomyces umbrinus]|uniref:alpha-L-rhamnosidase n=1 Tax=Streptomyces umbrinus TaxID=67370 RepID=UPI0016725CA7|nr:alpha-L-rhamnosidase [Streptomyces umbrinus]GHB60056.1 hypothetical protein GCM10010306_062030 [Streptomyces umbrinus]
MPRKTSGVRRRVVLSAAVNTAVSLGPLSAAVRAATTAGSPSAVAGETPPTAGNGWTARWIGRDTPQQWPTLGEQNPAPLLRREFRLGRRVAHARLDIVGLGYHEAWINGRRVGDQVLDPPPSAYDRTAYSRDFDVTALLHRGDNVIAVTLGRGYLATPETGHDLFGLSRAPWRVEPRLLAQLDIAFTNGTTARVVSDRDWKIADGPTLDALYFGEHHDARRARPGWTRPAYDDSAWQQAREQPAPTQNVVPAGMPPVMVTGTLDPVEVTTSKAGTTVYDFGRVTAGWARITVSAAPGVTTTLAYGEQLEDDGTVYRTGATSPAAVTHVDSYTSDGGGPRTWEPSFTRHGFRYIEVSSSEPLSSFRIQARVAHTALRSTGRFHSSEPLLNKIHANQRASLLDNMWGLPTDTPWRDRQGWTADGYLYLDSAALNFDVRRLYGQWLRTWRDSQKADGSLPMIVPNAGGLSFYNDPSWAGTLVLTAWGLYQHYGDAGVLRDNYEAMTRWMDLMLTTVAGSNGLYAGFSFGDWASPGSETGGSTSLAPPEGAELTANADLYREARTLARIAEVLDRRDDATRFDAMAEAVTTAFNAKFFDPGADQYRTTVDAGYRQTSNLVPLAYGLVPEGHEDAVFARLVKDVVDRGTRLNTGATGTKLLLPVLTEHGRGDLAYELATRTGYPSWGHWVRSGATTSWETWSITGKDHSMNHAFLGTVDDWFYTHLAGIRPLAPGYRKVLIAPLLPSGLSQCSASVTSPRGTISCGWRTLKDRVDVTVEVPDGTPAEVRIPVVAGRDRVTVGRGVTLVRKETARNVYRAAPGTHVFHVS